MIPGAQRVGTLYKIHPYDVAAFIQKVNKTTELVKAIESDDFRVEIQVGNDYYIQSLDVEPQTKEII